MPSQNIYISFVPDEEIGGIDGMKRFIESERFKELNVVLALDEGISNPKDCYNLFYTERMSWKAQLRATGNTGHGSQFIENLSTDKLLSVISKFNSFRNQQKQLLEENKSLKLGDVTTLNLTSLKSGVQNNIVPCVSTAVYDIRVAPDVNIENFKTELQNLCKESNVELEFLSFFQNGAPSPTEKNAKWCKAIKKTCRDMGIEVETEIFPAATDSRFLRKANIAAYGISPLRKTPVLLHDHNEFIYEDSLYEGLEFYSKLIPNLSNTN